MTSWFRDGPSDPVAREAGALHDAYFNHQPMVLLRYFALCNICAHQCVQSGGLIFVTGVKLTAPPYLRDS